MEILGYEINKKSNIQDNIENPPGKIRKEISYSDSPYFDKYQHRPYDPSVLWQRFGDYSIYDEMREDTTVKSVLTLKKMIVLNSDWVIECEDDNIREFLERCLDEYLDDVFKKKLFEILSGMDYGYSVTEKILGAVEYEGSQKWAFTTLKTRAPHGIEFHADDQGNLIFLLQHAGKSDLELDPSKFIIYSHNKEFQNWYGISELTKGVYEAWRSKRAIMKFWGIHLERYGSPLTVGHIPKTANQGEKELFQTIMKNIQAKTGITVGEGYELEMLQGASDGKSSYQQAVDSFDLMIARSMLIPDLMGFSGSQTGGGSYALGKEQFEMFYTTVEYIRDDLERIINRELIKPLVAWNFGNRIEANFKWQQIDQEKKSEDMKNWIEAVKTGKIHVPIEHMNHFYNQVDFPEVEESELQKIEDEKKAMAQQMQSGFGGGDEKENDKDNKKADKKKEEKEFTLESKKKRYRELKVFEKKVDFDDIERTIEGGEANYKKNLGDTFKLIINALVNDIRTKKIVEKKRIEQIGKLKLKHIARLRANLNKLMRDAYKLGRVSAKKEAEFIIDDPQVLDNEEIAKILKERNQFVIDTETSEIMKRGKNVLINGIRSGDGVREVMSDLETVFGDYSKARLETIVRTNFMESFNSGRTAQFQQMPNIEMYQFSAIMDGRTSDVCIAMDGKIFNKADLSLYEPPLHFNCRSLVVPIFSDEVEENQDLINSNEYSKLPKIEKDKNGFSQLTDKKDINESKKIRKAGGEATREII